MASTTFVDFITPIQASWLNDVDSVVYQGYFPLDATAAETAAGVTIVNPLFPPGYADRYGTNTTPGTTDMTTAVQAALNQQVNGGVKTVIRGNTKVTDNLNATFTGDFVIEGIEGATLTSSITDDGTYDAILELLGAATSHLVVSNLRINSTVGSGSTLYGLKVTNLVARADFENLVVTGCRYYGCEVNASHQVHKNCSYSDNVNGGLIPYGGYWELLGITCNNNGNGSDNTTGYGVVLSGTAGKIVGGNFLDNDRYGIDGRRANNWIVDGAYVYNTGYVGIYGVNEDAEKDSSNIKIVNCTVNMNDRTSSSHGIWVGSFGTGSTASVGEVYISGNTVKNSLDRGILVSTGTAPGVVPKSVTITDNQIEEVNSYGIYVGDQSINQIVINNNSVKNAGDVDIFANAATDIVITGNNIQYTGSHTRMIYTGTSTKFVCTGNVGNGTASTTAIDHTATGYYIGGNRMAGHFMGSATYDPGSLADGAGATTTVTVTGAALGDYANASFSLDLQGIVLTAWVSSANTVSVRFQNETTGTIDLASGTLKASIVKAA